MVDSIAVNVEKLSLRKGDVEMSLNEKEGEQENTHLQ